MPDIEIDTSKLTFPSFAIPEAATGFIDGSSSPRPTVSLPARSGYHLQQPGAALSEFDFEVKDDGTLDFDGAFDGFLSGRGERGLTVHGLALTLDGTALDHALNLQFTDAAPLAADRTHDLVLLPAARYRLDGRGGVSGAYVDFGLGLDGSVQVEPEFAEFASASGSTLTIQGYTISIDARALSHDLLPLGIQRPPEFLPRATVNQLTLLPAEGFRFLPGAGIVADLSYSVARDGQVTLGLEFAGFASASGSTLTVQGYTISIDARALSHDLLPIGIERPPEFLPRATVNQLTLLPAEGYRFLPGAGIVADLSYGVARDGHVTLGPEFGGFASASGSTLTVQGYTISIDARALSHDLLPIGIERPPEFLPRATVNQLTLLPAEGYRFLPGAGIVADLSYGVARDGHVTLGPEFGGFASASDSTLTVQGYTISIDARALSHDLLPIGIERPPEFLPRATVNQLTLLPAEGYRFLPGAGIVADLSYGVARDGHVTLGPEFGGFASASDSTLIIRGYPMVLSAAHADSELVSIATIGLQAQMGRELVAVLIPAKGYFPRTANGVFDTPFNMELDGTITFDAAAAGHYVVTTSASPNPSHLGEEVTINAYVRAIEPAPDVPRGIVMVSVGAELRGGATLDADGTAKIRTSLLPSGESDVVIEFAGTPEFRASSTVLRQRVVPLGWRSTDSLARRSRE